MKFKAWQSGIIAIAVSLTLAGCIVPKSEHDKVVKELQKAKQDMAMMSETAKKDRDAMMQQVTQLQGEVAVLKKENESLKSKKPAAKAPARKK